MGMFLKFINKIKIFSAPYNWLKWKLFYFHNPKVIRLKENDKTYYFSTSIDISNKQNIEFGNNVFIYHNTILDGFNGIKIGDFCQIGTKVGIFTHSSHNSIRLMGDQYFNISFDKHVGRIKGSVEIGAYTFVGPNSVIMPNTKIGKGCIVAAYSYVRGEFPDYSIIAGNPAKVVGSTTKVDEENLIKYPDANKYYYNK